MSLLLPVIGAATQPASSAKRRDRKEKQTLDIGIKSNGFPDSWQETVILAQPSTGGPREKSRRQRATTVLDRSNRFSYMFASADASNRRFGCQERTPLYG